MIGQVVVMEPAQYETWLSGRPGVGIAWRQTARTYSSSWAVIPATARMARAAARILVGLFGKPVALEDGSHCRADENYVRESIVNPDREGGERIQAHHADISGTRQ